MEARAVQQTQLDDEHAANVSDVELLSLVVHGQLRDLGSHGNVRREARHWDLPDNLASRVI